MESLADTQWDVVISGTGLQQSLLALSLSRSGKNILHVDASEAYGGDEAALTLQEARLWADAHRGDNNGIFTRATATREPDEDAGARSRGYSLALAPQMVHARSALLSQLVSSKAFRQIDFLAVGSFFIYRAEHTEGGEGSGSGSGSLDRVPSTREDVFSSTAIATRAKRALIKFLKFVLDYDSPPQTDLWKPHAAQPLHEFLATEFPLDEDLRAYIVCLTLSLDAQIPVEKGLAAIHRHLTSMGRFGAGFAAVYPKWGGLSEIAQVGCRAGAVGGAVYMLGVGVDDVRPPSSAEDQDPRVRVTLSNGTVVHTKRLVMAKPAPSEDGVCVSRLTAVVGSPLAPLFEAAVEGAPAPSVAVVAFPGRSGEAPVYAVVHSSDTGECPAGQSVVYLSTLSSPTSQTILATALSSLLSAVPDQPKILYRLSYEQTGATAASGAETEDGVYSFSPLPLDLAFDDASLAPVREAWEWIVGDEPEGRGEFMVFRDREGVDDDDFE